MRTSKKATIPMKHVLVMVCMILLSCKKEKAAKYSFQSCDLASKNTRILSNQSGTLSYTDEIGSHYLSPFSYFIKLNGQLPLEVCNIPSSVSLNKNETKNIVFSGKMVVLSDETDAVSTTIELSDLTFK